MKFPVITAHTSCMGTVPNTLESVMAGINNGADIIEMDVRATRDGIAVLAHDDSLETSLHGLVKIEDISYKELQTCNIKIVKLEEALELIRDYNKTANLDLKTGTALEAMAGSVRSMGMTDSVVLTGCGKEIALEIADRYKGFQVLMDVDTEPLLTGNSDYGTMIKMWCKDAIEASCSAFNIYYKICTEELMEYAAKRCLPVCIYTIDEEECMREYADMGVYSITTNRVDLLKSIRNKNR